MISQDSAEKPVFTPKNISLAFSILFLFIALISLAQGQLYSVDPCGQASITDNGNTYTYGNGCIEMTVSKTSFNQNFLVQNKLNGNTFQMTMQSISEESPTLDNEILFDTLSWDVDISQGYVKYLSTDGMFEIGYIIKGNTFKSEAKIINYNFLYPDSTLWVKNLVKKSDAKDTISYVEPIVDGVKGQISSRITTQGQNTFYWQDVGRGNLIVIDPVYFADYSPVPAEHLYTGDVVTYEDSMFPFQDNIVSGVSDNSTSTSYEVYRYGLQQYDDWSLFYTAGVTNYTAYVKVEDGNFTPDLNIDGSAKAGQILLSSPVNNGTLVKVRMKSDDVPKYVYFKNTANTKQYGKILVDSLSLKHYNFTMANVSSGGVSDIRFHDGSQGGAMHTYWDYIEVDIPTSTEGKAIAGRWNQTYNSSYNWYVRIYIPITGNHSTSVYAYNSSNIISDQFVKETLLGTGWFNINITSLLDYETNTQGMTFSQFRVFTDYSTNISELVLRKEANDTEPPVINLTSCVITDEATGLEESNFGCLDTIEFQCNITDNLDVDRVFININGVSHEMILDIDHYDFYITPDIDGTTTYNWTYVNATDISGLTTELNLTKSANYTCNFADYINITHSGILGVDQLNLTNTSINLYWTTSNPSNSHVHYGLTPTNLSGEGFNETLVTEHLISLTGLTPNTTYFYSLTSEVNPNQTVSGFNFTTLTGCIEDWVEDTPVCMTNNTYLSTYTDQNACGTTAMLPAQNGTYQFCNYCSEDLVQTLGVCQVDETQTIDYTDNNYASCCLVTGLSSDCSIEVYPYNETTTQFCQYFERQLGNITCQDTPYFNGKEKEYCLSYIPLNYTNESFKCISYVMDTSNFEVLQTNPEYRERSQSLFEIFRQDPETREWFTPANTLVNFYYTSKNLLPETNYTLTIECSSNQRTLKSQMPFEIRYEDYEFVFFRTKWLMENAGYIIAGLLMIFIIIVIILTVWRGATR